jgi:two-component system LytT family sensor kinase
MPRRLLFRNAPYANGGSGDANGIGVARHGGCRYRRPVTTSRRLPKAWLLVSAAWIVPAVFATVDRVVQTRLNGWDPVTMKDLIWAGGDWFLYAFLTPIVFVVSRRWPLERPHLTRRALFHLAMSLVFCVAWATAGKVFQFSLGLLFDSRAAQTADAGHLWLRIGKDWLSWVFTTFPFGVAVYLCEVGVEHAVRLWVEARDRELQVARRSEQLTGARFAALQAQLNPHFLFNSLNTVTVLIRDGDATAATRVIEQLSDVLRRTLNRRGANEVALDEELELVRQYLAVEEARFSDRLRPEFAIDPSTLSAAIPSFVVQHLVENAVRHGIARRTHAGRVAIGAKRAGDSVEITVSDDGPGLTSSTESAPGHGIANTRERLATLYGNRASLTIAATKPFGTIATLRMPFKELIRDSGTPS